MYRSLFIHVCIQVAFHVCVEMKCQMYRSLFRCIGLFSYITVSFHTRVYTRCFSYTCGDVVSYVSVSFQMCRSLFICIGLF